MNKQSILKSISIIALFVVGTAQSLAWSVPQNGPDVRTIGNVPSELINTGCKVGSSGTCTNRQGKSGPFITESFLKAGNQFAWATPGTIVAENFILSGTSAGLQKGNAYFKKVFAPGNQGQLVFGDARSTVSSDVPVVGKFTNGKDKVKLIADTQFCNTQTMITTDTPAIQFWSSDTGSNANIIARGVQLSGGNPQPGMILISTDEQGNAVWATPVLNADGTITFNSSASPVVAGQASCN
jgi:hypothetical protein